MLARYCDSGVRDDATGDDGGEEIGVRGAEDGRACASRPGVLPKSKSMPASPDTPERVDRDATDELRRRRGEDRVDRWYRACDGDRWECNDDDAAGDGVGDEAVEDEASGVPLPLLLPLLGLSERKPVPSAVEPRADRRRRGRSSSEGNGASGSLSRRGRTARPVSIAGTPVDDGDERLDRRLTADGLDAAVAAVATSLREVRR